MEAVEKLIKAIGAAKAARDLMPEVTVADMNEAIQLMTLSLQETLEQAIEDATQDAG